MQRHELDGGKPALTMNVCMKSIAKGTFWCNHPSPFIPLPVEGRGNSGGSHSTLWVALALAKTG